MKAIKQRASLLCTASNAVREERAENLKQRCGAVKLKRFGNPGIRTDHLLTA